MLSSGDVNFTIAAWVYLDSKPGNNVSLVTKYGETTGEFWLAWLTSADRFYFEVASDGYATFHGVSANTFGVPAVGQWYFVTCWYDSAGGSIGIAINGGPADVDASTVAVSDQPSVPFMLGASAYGPSNTASDFLDGRLGLVGFWKRVLSAPERVQLYANPYAILQPSLPMARWLSVVPIQIAYPVSDVSTGDWAPVPATPPTLYDKIDEASADDADYIMSREIPLGDTVEVHLSALTPPGTTGGHAVRTRIRKNWPGGYPIDLTVAWVQGSTVIASHTHADLTGDWIEVADTLTPGEAAAITDDSDLRIRFTANQR
jgi:hypothetical protein